MKKVLKPMAIILLVLSLLGIMGGAIFERITRVFIKNISFDVEFTMICMLAGFLVGLFSFLLVKIILYNIKKYYEKAILDKGLSSITFKSSTSKDTILNMKDEFEGLLENYYSSKAKEAETLKKLSITDSVTGVYNHRYLFNFFEEQVSYGYKNIFVLFCDIDHFKKINELNGHDIGDSALNIIAKIIKTVIERELGFFRHDSRILKPKGEVFRYGGEEFVALLLCNDIDDAFNTAERIRKEILECSELQKLCGNSHISISVGLSAYPSDGCDAEAVIEKANKALAYAKRLGRNKCYVYTAKLDNAFIKDMLSYYEIEVLLKFIDFLTEKVISKDSYAKSHSEEVMKYALLLGDKLNLTDAQKHILKIGATLHDIGKITISEEIINNAGILSKDEWEILKYHTVIGSNIVKNITSLSGIDECILCHHERWDGKGYPYGISGKDIPLLARIISICDAYHAMISDLPYSAPLSKTQALEELKENKGLQFDPELVDIFIELIKDSDNESN